MISLGSLYSLKQVSLKPLTIPFTKSLFLSPSHTKKCTSRSAREPAETYARSVKGKVAVVVADAEVGA